MIEPNWLLVLLLAFPLPFRVLLRRGIQEADMKLNSDAIVCLEFNINSSTKYCSICLLPASSPLQCFVDYKVADAF